MRRRYNVSLGDAREVLRELPTRRFQCVVTSPPYWGVRDYNSCDQIGSEPLLSEYLENLVDVFREVHRVIRNDGVFWLNVGDVYSSGNRKYRSIDPLNSSRGLPTRPSTPNGLKPKDLIGIPWRLAFSLQDAGWYFRTEVVWNKTNPMPESVKDRPSRGHEYLFMFTKTKRYQFSRATLESSYPDFRRTVWSHANAKSVVDGHSSVFPETLIEPCIAAATLESDEVLDPFCGSGTVGAVCMRLKRRFFGIDVNPIFVDATRLRCRSTLKIKS